MIPDIAIIIAAYAIARLLNEYVFEDAKLQPLRFGVAILAAGVIVFFLLDVVSLAGSTSDLGL